MPRGNSKEGGDPASASVNPYIPSIWRQFHGMLNKEVLVLWKRAYV